MKRSSILLTISGGILTLGLLMSVFIPQSVALDAEQRKIVLSPMEDVRIEHYSEQKEELNGIYTIRMIAQGQNNFLEVKIVDPDHEIVVNRYMELDFLIDTFSTSKEGNYYMRIINPTDDTIEISARLGHTALGPASPLLSLVVPSAIISSGIGLLIAGMVFYFLEKRKTRL